MRFTLPPAVSKVFALAILLGILAALYGLVVNPIMTTHQELEETIADSRYLLSQYRQAGTQRQELQAVLDNLRADASAASGYVEASSEALAAATLQERLKAVIARHDGQLRSTQDLSTLSENELTRVGVRVQMIGDIEALSKIFHDLESGRPYLFLDNIDLRPTGSRRSRNRAPNQAADVEVALMARYDVFGYMSVAP
jgi:general secretion pathway protein M